MLNDVREEYYFNSRRKRKLKRNQVNQPLSYTVTRSTLTPAQAQRIGRKAMCRKTHEHDRSSVPEGQKFRCPKCSPIGFTESTAIKAAPGPRDWTREDIHQRSVL